MRTNEFLKQNPPDTHSWKGKVTFGFSYPVSGWIQLAVTCTTYVQGVIIDISYAFDPFPDFVHWLEAIAKGQLPAEFIIDEEGNGKILRASPVDNDDFLFEILEEYWTKDEEEEQPLYLYTQVSKKQFLSEFLRKWEDFLSNYYNPAEWELHDTPDLRKLDVSKIRAFCEG